MSYYSHRYKVRITFEAETPLSVGSGEKGITTDRLIVKDANGLPYIPGTGLTGVLRHSFDDSEFVKDVFGDGGKNGKGSRLIVSSAHLVGEDGETVIEGLKNLDMDTGYYSFFSRLPERDHVRMSHKGAADTKGHGKFDEELVHKGTRFVFEMELLGNERDKENWEKLLDKLSSPVFRVGAGTRKGFGRLKIITEKSKFKIFDLTKNLNDYLNQSSSLNSSVSDWNPLELNNTEDIQGWKLYEMDLKPKDFFLFGAGFGDDDADNKSKTEKYFEWSTGKPVLTEMEHLLIPATSIKGILSHRTAYHYNRANNVFIENSGQIVLETALDIENSLNELEEEMAIDSISDLDSTNWEEWQEKIESLDIDDISFWREFKEDLNDEAKKKKLATLPVGEGNEAVKGLFGFSKDSDSDTDGQRGRVIIDDVYIPMNQVKEKVFNHTRIDRFTGGTIDGALFQEKAAFYDGEINLKIWVQEDEIKEKGVLSAFEKALDDVREGRLQLGGNSSKGHGVFVES